MPHDPGMTDDVAALIAVLDAWTDARAAGAPGPGHDRTSAADASLRAERAARALGALGASAQAAVPALVRAMHADQRGMGEVAAPALGRIGGEQAVRALNRVWFSGWDRKLCEACHGALVHLGAGAHEALLGALHDPEPVDRLRALHGLRAANYPEAALASLALRPLRDAPMTVIDAVIDFVGGFTEAKAAAIALPALRAIADDDRQFDSTRRHAADVVVRLTGRLSTR